MVVATEEIGVGAEVRTETLAPAIIVALDCFLGFTKCDRT